MSIEDEIAEVVIDALGRLLDGEDRSDILKDVLARLHELAGMHGEPWYPPRN